MKKINFVSFNLFYCISSFIIPYQILSNLFVLESVNQQCMVILFSFYIYYLDLKINTDSDFNSAQINELKKEIEEIKKTK